MLGDDSRGLMGIVNYHLHNFVCHNIDAYNSYHT